jgi:hypothetical protein
MGWWRIDGPSGQINWSAGFNGGNAVLFNCVPGRDDPAQLYNGDEPADILDAAIKNITELLQDPSCKEAAKKAFTQLFCENEKITEEIQEQLREANKKINEVYQREWRRAPTPAELSAVFEFCTSFTTFDCV